ncbi:hypothetical protein EH223_04775 [candidate division KSB1 bacterium]|nr:hypothetical protein [candidate division KSB1 bacterium]RQW05593.1 MAG: hypothetical protein EH223_04775 [candidate division KSB1 bacterium]
MKQQFNFPFFMLIAFLFLSIHRQNFAQQMQIFFKEATFDEFIYPYGEIDEQFTAIIAEQSAIQFPKARFRKVTSCITLDKPRKVVSHYANLCGKRFQKIGERFTYTFSEINNIPATRIEIYPVEIGRIHHEFWPTRIDLYMIRYPISVDVQLSENRSSEMLEQRVGRFFYEGTLKEDVALLDMEEYGSDAEVFVVETFDDFEDVYQFFRRRYGPFRVRPARDGDLLTRDFEIDISRALSEEDSDKLLYLYVEENPLVVDRNGNSQVYRNKVFIRYVFWKKDDEDYLNGG